MDLVAALGHTAEMVRHKKPAAAAATASRKKEERKDASAAAAVRQAVGRFEHELLQYNK
jgi:hypothetical protein